MYFHFGFGGNQKELCDLRKRQRREWIKYDVPALALGSNRLLLSDARGERRSLRSQLEPSLYQQSCHLLFNLFACSLGFAFDYFLRKFTFDIAELLVLFEHPLRS